ncbi:Glyoxylase, beta-lactamase superfamily II [Friedmanniella luteola]|uniref:Glyoxylase, beta-lactamase superfamily II n=1 Tax=Friedmanniella luteola TaxID=546871 RepID=A0A1H1X596_9ACTN|nr:MBL fold metallo-hydrolase [Friedmanniella luteola]SDT04535.1 Glyoxylase, beta-lactamase superfamily II [Friedmanniella luteola]
MDQQPTAGQPRQGGAAPPFSLGPWREVAEGVLVCVAEPDAVNLGLVLGRTGALLVDTGSSPEQGAAVRAAVAAATDLPLVGVVVTHAHPDHAFGLAAFGDVPTLGHETLPAALASAVSAGAARALGVDPAALAPPAREIAVAVAVDLGDRRVEVAHLGPGHTEGDLVVVVPDADLLFVGDLVESAPTPETAAPWWGPDSVPHAWGATLDGVIGLMTAGTRAVPGHGDLVDREFVFGTRGRVAAVSGELTHLVESGVAEADALARGSWPYPAEHVAGAVAPGYAALAGRGVKGTRPTLPLA